MILTVDGIHMAADSPISSEGFASAHSGGEDGRTSVTGYPDTATDDLPYPCYGQLPSGKPSGGWLRVSSWAFPRERRYFIPVRRGC